MYEGGSNVVLLVVVFADVNGAVVVVSGEALGSGAAMFIRCNTHVADAALVRRQRWGDTRELLRVAAANTNNRVNKN